MGYSREQIRDAVTWGGSSSDGDPDSFFQVLEEADPKLVAKIRAEVTKENKSMADAVRASGKEVPFVKSLSEKDILAEERRYRRSLPFNFIQD